MLGDTNMTNENVENTSGKGKGAAVPSEIRGWSWGAFLLTWIWGIGNSTYIAFLMFCPLVNVVFWFVLGAKGRQWAWQNRRWESVEQFNKTQKRWGLAGLILFLAGVIFWVMMLSGTFLIAFKLLNNSDSTKLALTTVQSNPRLQTVIGRPIVKSGNAQGKINTKSGIGNARINFPVTGTRSKGRVSFTACKVNERWYLTFLRYNDATNPADSVSLRPSIAPPCAD